MGLGQKQSVLSSQLGNKLHSNTNQLGNKKSFKNKYMNMNDNQSKPIPKMSDLEKNNSAHPYPTA